MIVFFSLVVLTAATRLIELSISKRHRRELLAQGSDAVDDPGFLGMALLHTGVLVFAVAEVLVLHRHAPTWLMGLSAVGVVSASGLRIWAIRSLGQHWNVRVVDSTNLGVVSQGPYRWVRHPNYVAVFLELALLPLVQGAWLTASLGTLLHLGVLRRRIRVEESALFRDPEYVRVMGPKPRFLPKPLAAGSPNRDHLGGAEPAVRTHD